MRPITVFKPRVNRDIHPEEAIFNVPTRSLRWLDRANLLTLMGKSLENEWRRSKDAHRRYYMAWLQRIGCIETTCPSATNLESEGTTSTSPSGKRSTFQADWAEFPGTRNDRKIAYEPQHYESNRNSGIGQANVDDMNLSDLKEEVKALRLKLSQESS